MSFWKHNPTVTFIRHDKAIITCSCGMKSPKIPRAEVEDRIAEHRAKYLREQKRPK